MANSVQPKMKTRPKVLKSQRIPELMAADIRRRVLRGELKEGDSLPPETELMNEYGVSRPSLREALRILESEQLIEVRRGGIGGALVRRPDLDVATRQFGFVLQDRGATIADVHRTRCIIEPSALAELAVKISPKQLTELHKRLEDASEFIGEPIPYARALEEIRERMVEMTGAIALSLIMKLLGDVVQKHTTAIEGISQAQSTKLHRLNQKSYKKLLDLISAGDRQGAKDYWEEHLADVGRNTLGRNADKPIIDLEG